MKPIKLTIFCLLAISSLESRSQTAKDYYEQGFAKVKAKDYNGSVEAFTKAISLKPDEANYYYYRGISKTLLKDTSAQSDFAKTIQLDPQNAKAYGFLGMSKFKLKKFEEAIVDFDKEIKLKPEIEEAYFYKGSSLMELKQYDEAIVQLNKAIELRATYTGAYYMRGLTEYMKKDYAAAVNDFDKTSSLEADYSVKLFYFRGLSKEKLGQKEEACSDFKKSLAAGYKDAEEMITKYCQ